MPLVPVGRFFAPQGEVVVSPQRVNHWVKSHQKITTKRYKVPEPWGHQLEAVPADDKMAMRFAKSRWNAGFVNRLEQDAKTGALVVVGEVPPGYSIEKDKAGNETGRLVNEKDHTVISEMSAGIGNWRDGTGEVHRDVIVHAAFCTLPVVGGQPGFTSTLSTDGSELLTATLATDGVEYLYTLGSRGEMMDDDKKPGKDKPKSDDKPDMDIPPTSDLDTGDVSPIPLDPAPMPAPQPMASNLPMAIPDAQKVNDVVGLFAAMGLTLPTDTNPQSFMQNLSVALTTLAAIGYKLCPPNQGGMATPEAKIDTSTDGATPESAGPSMAFMSSDPEHDGPITLSADAAVIADTWAKEQKAGYRLAFENLRLPEEVARQQLAYLDKAKPSLDPTSKRVSFPELKDRLQLAKAAGGGRQAVQNQLTTTAPAVKVDKPAEATVNLSTEVDQEAVVESVQATQTSVLVDKEYMNHLISESGLQRK